MKRFLTTLFVFTLFFSAAQAVLKEKDLARTLGVLRAELTSDYNRQQMFMQMYEQQGARQHEELVSYMNRCEQIGLMLYSQSTENTFDLAYACQQAVDLFRELHNPKQYGNKFHAYDRAITRIKSEIERYNALITSLKSIPPVADENLLSESDSILLSAIDSLEAKRDSLEELGEKQKVPMMPTAQAEAEMNHEPLFLTGQQLEDRAFCLAYAQQLKSNLENFLETLEAESSYYKSVQKKVNNLNRFAQMRYKILQDNIFKEGGTNYFTILANLPRFIMMAKRAATSKYKPFAHHDKAYSDWRGMPIMFISIFVILYLSIAMILSWFVLRFIIPQRWLGKEDYKTRRHMLVLVVGTALFAIIVMMLRHFIDRPSFRMGTGLIINMAWLMEVIFLSLYIRLKKRNMLQAAYIYLPLLVLSFIVIMFRIVLIPNGLLNLIFPPILLLFTLWQLWMSKRHRSELPLLDIAYTHITSLAMVVSCIVAWVGYTLLAVQIMVWWTLQLAAITTITCIYHLMEKYEIKHLVRRIAPMGGGNSQVLKDIKRGEYITQTWFYDLLHRTVVPILAVISVLGSIYWAAEVFEMTSFCHNAFFTNFVDQKDLIQISLFKLCLVVALWFVFRYINYAVRSFYLHFRKLASNADDSNANPNMTLARNIIAIICWGIYFIIVLVILNVPKSGISIVTAGLATGLGFAMQELIENFFYGISLMAGRLRVGDYIECDSLIGRVESITYQSTQIITADGCVISFLNKDLLGKNFKNMTHNHSYELISIPVGVAYGTDVEQVRQFLTQAIDPIREERSENGLPLTDPNRPITVRFSDFGASSVDLKVNVWMLVEERYALMARIKEIIYNTLNENHITIPFPQRDIHLIQ